MGYNSGGRITESFATGTVDGIEIVGGLVGYNNDGTVSESYAQGAVTGDRRVSGLVGEHQDFVITPKGGRLTQVYATGRVTATEELTGGLVATDSLAVIENSYWDAEATGQARALGTRTENMLYAAGKLQTADMQGSVAKDNMPDFDFTDTWQTVDQPADYPQLQWEDETSSGDDGSGDDGSSSSGSNTIDQAIAGSDGVIGITDIQQAIRYWANDEAVPNTGGQTIGIVKIQSLIQQWASGG